MDQENTTTFSSIGDFYSTRLTTVDEVCPIHHVHKVMYMGHGPICIECAKPGVEKVGQARVDEYFADVANYKQEQKSKDTQGWLESKSIYLDKSLSKATFDSYLTDDQETSKNKSMAQKLAKQYLDGADFNTIFSGKPGTGKSHLAMSMLKEVNENSHPSRRCLFVSIDELMRKIRSSFSNDDSPYTEEAMTDLLIKPDLLVIDDLGAETGAIASGKLATDFTTRVLYAIVNGRMTKPTIFTTNLSSRDMSKIYDAKLISRIFRDTKGHIVVFKETTDKRVIPEF